MSQLFEDDGSESELNIKTDTNFAKNYNVWRKKEELNRLQTKYGNENSESSSSSEDDEGDDINDKFEKEFFKTLSCLKNKDPRIYDKNFEFFDKRDDVNNGLLLPAKKKKKEQPVYIKDYERKLILEKGGQLSDDDEEQNLEPRSSTYVEEQQKLKESLKDVLEAVDNDQDEDSEWGGLFKTRQKTTEEKIKEEQDYLQWLAGQKEHLQDENVENDLKPLKDFWNNPKLDEGEKFLRDYVLKKKFLDSEETDYIPTYEEVVHDSDQGLSEDEEALSTQEEFEHKYNFRFEEPDQDFIKRYPRTMENSLRQKDDKRKVKRIERKERKIKEKQQKMEEIQQLRALKKSEIEEKINQLKEITGNAEVGFDVKDIEDDFDPEEHDRRMQALFSDEFYQGPEGEQKPEFPELDKELELENWDYWHGDEDGDNEKNLANEEHQPHCEDEDFNMDCDYDPANTQQELIENSKKKKKRKRKSNFAKVLSQPKPAFDPTDKTYQQYLDEYYKLDCEDVIGDIPCRFKYREVVPNSFGLSIEEILTAKDKELNRWCSIKKAIQHRPDHVEKYDIIAFEKKGKNLNLKKKCLPSLFAEEKIEDTFPSTSSSHTENDSPKKNNKQTKSNTVTNDSVNSNTKDEIQPTSTLKFHNTKDVFDEKKKQQTVTESVDETTKAETSTSSISAKNTKNNRKRKSSSNKIKHENNKKAKEDIGISNARLTAYGINPKKFKNKLKYGNN